MMILVSSTPPLGDAYYDLNLQFKKYDLSQIYSLLLTSLCLTKETEVTIHNSNPNHFSQIL